MKKSTIVLIELGMIAGIILAGCVLPGNTSLSVFLIASGAVFIAGNILLVQTIKAIRARESSVKSGPWPHILRALAILAGGWLLSLLLSRR